ncbi:glycosyltransferase family 4 protein [Thalassobius sp. MITS945101]|uniref:glycosyltransferase family 4 protein n=1 Tax=Thalassobius sp. MITS945101 TaxID=3096994 RepID=UPI00399A6C7B
MTADAQTSVRLLDVTRLMRRAGRVLTGVDRVEMAYLEQFLRDALPVYGLLRTRYGYLLLDRAGLTNMAVCLRQEADWGPVGVLSRLGRAAGMQKRAESDLRRWAVARCLPTGLLRCLQTHLGQGFTYVNVGHSNLTQRVLHAMHRRQAKVAVMVHDTIPLDYPQYQREGSVAPFKAMLGRVGEHADLILCNSAQTAADVARHLGSDHPETLVAPLGVTLAAPTPVQMPEGFNPNRAFMMTLGTIEPRKNHTLLLDVWEALPEAERPQLLICGSRGWNNEAVFDRLDHCGRTAGPVFEMPGLSDGQIAHLMGQARAFLFPSFAEGYGLPPLEAAALGCPVICSDLPILKELLGNNAVYLPLNDLYSWTIRMAELARDPQADPQRKSPELARFVPPTWGEHFNVVLSRL